MNASTTHYDQVTFFIEALYPYKVHSKQSNRENIPDLLIYHHSSQKNHILTALQEFYLTDKADFTLP